MDPSVGPVIEALIPIVAILATFGTPVVLYLGNRYFKLKEKELALEAEARTWAEKSHATLQERVQRLESVLLALAPGPGEQVLREQQQRDQQQRDAGARAHLMEGPATPASAPQPSDQIKVR